MGGHPVVMRTATSSVAPVPSLVCESYVRLLMWSLTHHRRTELAMRGASAVGGRLSVLPTGSRSRQILTQSTLVRLVSIAEAFTATRLVELMSAQVPRTMSLPLADLYAREEIAATNGWADMARRYKAWASKIELKNCDSYGTVLTLSETRNAILHGLGALTKRQQRDPNLPGIVSGMKALGVDVSPKHDLWVSTTALTTAVREIRSFMESLDSKVNAIP
jgi:hypothetical protein